MSPSGSSRIQASNALNRASVSRGQPRGAGLGAATAPPNGGVGPRGGGACSRAISAPCGRGWSNVCALAQRKNATSPNRTAPRTTAPGYPRAASRAERGAADSSTGAVCSARSRTSRHDRPSLTSAGAPSTTAVATSTACRMIP